MTVHTTPFHRSHYPLSPFTLLLIFLFHRSHYYQKDTIIFITQCEDIQAEKLATFRKKW